MGKRNVMFNYKMQKGYRYQITGRVLYGWRGSGQAL
jgi:hypothetical protein